MKSNINDMSTIFKPISSLQTTHLATAPSTAVDNNGHQEGTKVLAEVSSPSPDERRRRETVFLGAEPTGSFCIVVGLKLAFDLIRVTDDSCS
jgi:hypothetical protein